MSTILWCLPVWGKCGEMGSDCIFYSRLEWGALRLFVHRRQIITMTFKKKDNLRISGGWAWRWLIRPVPVQKSLPQVQHVECWHGRTLTLRVSVLLPRGVWLQLHGGLSPVHRSEVGYTLRLKVGLFRLCVGVIALVFLFIEPRNFHGNSPCATLLTDSWKSMRLLSVV